MVTTCISWWEIWQGVKKLGGSLNIKLSTCHNVITGEHAYTKLKFGTFDMSVKSHS